MKRTTLTFLAVLLLTRIAAAQAPACATFEGTTLDDWTAVNATAVLAAGGGRRYVDIRDGSGASNFVAPAGYAGNWLPRTFGCGSICFDINVLDDGLPTSTTVTPYFVIADAAGHSATFLPANIVEGSGWRTVCAPIAPLANGYLPWNGQGTWKYGANTTAADWSALLENVQTFRLAVDFAGNSAASERFLLDNICFRPQTCIEPPPGHVPADQLQMAPNVNNWKGCPAACQTIVEEKGKTYSKCEWTRMTPPSKSLGLMQYIPGTKNEALCDPGVPLDVEPRHRLFVHGIHADGTTWDKWIQRVKPPMDYLGYKTVADSTGYTSSYGIGTAALLTQVNELAGQINSGFGNVPDGSVWVYAHSLGALKMEALLQLGLIAGKACGFGPSCTDPLYHAAKKIGPVYVFQGAHGGCSVNSLLGDRGYHGPSKICPASLDIGRVNDSRLLPVFSRTIPGTQTVWNMNDIVWRGRGAQEKRITYVIATSKSGAKVCKGGWGIICGDGRSHDGVVYADQMTPPYDKYAEAVSAGLVSVRNEGSYCHIADDRYPPPRQSTSLMVDYVGLKTGPYDYMVGKRIEVTPSQTIAVCNQQCYCGTNREDACLSNVDCTRFEVPPFQTCIRLVSGGGNPTTGIDWSRQQVFNISWATEAPTGWTRCAAENGVCAVTGTRLVRYGADRWWATKTVTGSTPCTNAGFGDPAPGFVKTCEVQSEPPDPRWLSVIQTPDVN